VCRLDLRFRPLARINFRLKLLNGRIRYAVFFLTSDSNSARIRRSSRSTRARSLSTVSK